MKSTLYANPLEKVRFSQNWVKFTQTKLSGNLQIEFSTLFQTKILEKFEIYADKGSL